MKKNLPAILGILIPVVASLAIYYLSTLQPNIICLGYERGVELDNQLVEDRYGVTYQQARLRFKNFSFKAGYVDRVELVPTSLSKNLDVKVLEIEKVRLGWREEKVITIKFIANVNLHGITAAQETVRTYGKFFDNMGNPIPTQYGAYDFFIFQATP